MVGHKEFNRTTYMTCIDEFRSFYLISKLKIILILIKIMIFDTIFQLYNN